MPASAFEMLNRRTIRSIPNPLDRSTVVSIFPRQILEEKFTTQPSQYFIDKGSKENPAILVVEPASWWREVDLNQPLIEITNSSIQVAESFIRDYCVGLLRCNMTDMMPGIFFIPGEFKLTEIKTKYPNLIEAADKKQKNWFTKLVQEADSLWSRTQGNPLAIPDLCRLAAAELGLKDSKPWTKDFEHASLVKCIACGNMRNPDFPICPNCKTVVDKTKAKELGLVFAKE
jgi:hypothetical protein